MFFFKIPKLGSYFSVLLKYSWCLNFNAFTLALEDRLSCDAKRAE